LATTTEADFGRGGEGIEKLLAKVHKHKKLKFVVKIPGDGGAGGTAGTKTTTPTSTGATTGDIQPR
jgi:hypothetical protein